MAAGFMTHVTCRLTAENRDQLRNPTLGIRVWATFTFLPSVARGGLTARRTRTKQYVVILSIKQSRNQHLVTRKQAFNANNSRLE